MRLIMERWAHKCAIVTGAASGIGKEITIALLKNKINVLALDVNTEKLSLLNHEWMQFEGCNKLCIMRCDTSNEKDLERCFSFVETEWNSGVDIMVNNAEVIELSRIIESDRAAFEKLLNINVLATAMCINRAVRSMRQRNVEGHIFNINSVLGRKIPTAVFSEIDGCNGWNLYPVCKHANVTLMQSVKQELIDIKAPIRITSINPGLVETDLFKHSPHVMEVIKNMPILKAEDIANAVIYALSMRPEVQMREKNIMQYRRIL
ncbi:farnesol dehydrogenase-like isoform X2 [Apis dorsata]|uniref:farnesol dehydrogenase-like isoform X2 n=1 Tax=Apis dorsata TaxID=7462 RepID=UPI0003DF4B5C|nr:farnesol dehydrogenase-like isoform X2 [Apis dorsata]